MDVTLTEWNGLAVSVKEVGVKEWNEQKAGEKFVMKVFIICTLQQILLRW
jgi:hypothetical protein